MPWGEVLLLTVSTILISNYVAVGEHPLTYVVERAKKMVDVDGKKTIKDHSNVCNMDAERLSSVCQEAAQAVTKVYSAQKFKFSEHETTSVARVYKLSRCLRRRAYVKACKCPTIPAIYLRDKKFYLKERVVFVTVVNPQGSGWCCGFCGTHAPKDD